MRQIAWLDTRPDKADGDKSKTPEPTRRERLKKDGVDFPDLPHCTAIYLAAYLFEIGPTVPTGMGDAPIPHSEIAAWQANTGIRLSPWEALTLRRMSVDFASECAAAQKRDCKSPLQAQESGEDKSRVDKLVQSNAQKNAFRNLANL